MQGGAAAKRAGLVRPSSGYYSLTVTAKGMQPSAPDTDSDAGRHSPTDVSIFLQVFIVFS